jgi:hypothetical protein
VNLQIANEIQAEQEHGRQKYGKGPNDFGHDDLHAREDWHQFIADMNERARNGTPMERRQYLIKVAGLCVSAVESLDRRMKGNYER